MTWYRSHEADRRRPRSSSRRKTRPLVESLESRVVLYTATGNAWPAPQLITISFMPDGTNINGYSSNLFTTLNAKFGSASAWQNLILKAAQLWAQQTNINFAVVSDNGGAAGSGSNQEGDPNLGDVRIGGYNQNSTALAMAYAPPPVNNYSVAGDVIFNTGQSFNNGSAYDLLTVAAHEIGHALGLGHSTTTAAEMYSAYNGVKSALNADDIAGIRSIYSAGAARTPDANDAAGNGNTIATAVNVSSSLNGTTKAGVVTGLDITTTSDVDYYQVTAPTGSSATATIVVQSKGLSLLSPVLTVYASDKTTVKATVSGLNQYGTTLTATLTGVTPGTVYYIKVAGADTTACSTGKYALDLNFGTGATPPPPLPVTTKANGSPMSSGGGIATRVNGEVQVNAYTTGVQTFDAVNPHTVGMDASGNYVIVWTSAGEDGSGRGIYGQRFDKNGVKQGGEFLVNTTTAGDQNQEAVAMNATGSFVVTWTSAGQDGSGLGVYAQRYDSSGNKVGTEFLVNTTTAGDQCNPSVGISATGSFVIVWQSSGQDGDGWGIYGQKYDYQGNKSGTEFQVNTTTAGDQTCPSVSMSGLGKFVVAWTSAGQDGSGLGVFAQMYDASSNKVGTEFQVNTTTSGDQTNPSVALSALSGFVIVWQSNGTDSSGWGVYGQRYDINGNKIGTEFRANTYTTGDQCDPVVSIDVVGNYDIAWQSSGEDGSGWGVFARQYFTSGGAVDVEVQASGSTVGDQMTPAIAMDSLGHVVMAWTGAANGLDQSGVFMQRFSTVTLAEASDGFSPWRDPDAEPAAAPTVVPQAAAQPVVPDVMAVPTAVQVQTQPPVTPATTASSPVHTIAPAKATTPSARPRNVLLNWARNRSQPQPLASLTQSDHLAMI